MDAGVRQKRVEALEKIKENALERAKEGADSFEVRNFVTEAKKELAYQLPDEEAFKKAVRGYASLQGFKRRLRLKFIFTKSGA
jgi:acyl carrier protein